MDKQTLFVLLVLMVVVAAIWLLATRKVRGKPAQPNNAAETKAGEASSPPSEMSDADVRSKLQVVVGGGPWEQWQSIPAPRPGATNVRPKTAQDQAQRAADPEAPPDTKVEAVDPKPR